MSAQKKKLLSQASIEELTQNYRPGISSKIFELLIYVPHEWVENPEPNLVIGSNFATQKQLRSLIDYSSVTSIERVNKTNLALSMEVVEPYMNLFYGVCRNMPEQAEIRVRATKRKEDNNE